MSSSLLSKLLKRVTCTQCDHPVYHSFTLHPLQSGCALVKATSILITKSNGYFPIFVLLYISGAFGNVDHVHSCPPKVIVHFPVCLIHFYSFLTVGSSLSTHHSHTCVLQVSVFSSLLLIIDTLLG